MRRSEIGERKKGHCLPVKVLCFELASNFSMRRRIAGQATKRKTCLAQTLLRRLNLPP